MNPARSTDTRIPHATPIEVAKENFLRGSMTLRELEYTIHRLLLSGDGDDPYTSISMGNYPPIPPSPFVATAAEIQEWHESKDGRAYNDAYGLGGWLTR